MMTVPGFSAVSRATSCLWNLASIDHGSAPKLYLAPLIKPPRPVSACACQGASTTTTPATTARITLPSMIDPHVPESAGSRPRTVPRRPRFGPSVKQPSWPASADLPTPVTSRTQSPASDGPGPSSSSLGLARRHDLFRQAAGQLRQTVMAVGEGADPGSRRTQLDNEIADLGLGHVGLDRVPAGPAFAGIESEELAAAAGNDLIDPRRCLAGHMQVDMNDRLEQNRLTLVHAVRHGHAGRRLEGHFRGIDAVVAAVRQVDLDVDHREAERPVLHVFDDAGLDRGDILLGHHAAGDRVAEQEAFAPGPRGNLDHDVAELAVSARLLLVTAAHLHALADRLLIGDVTRLRAGIDAEFPGKALECDPEMHLALAPQHHFVGFLVVIEAQRGILLHQLGDRAGELDLVLAVGDRDGEAVDGIGGRRADELPGLALDGRYGLARLDVLKAAK